MTGNILSIQRLSKKFDDRKLLDKINLEVKEGEIIAINGSSGCGKTTLLKIIGMLENRDGGKIVFEGKQYKNKHQENSLEQRRKISMVFQKPVALNTSSYNNIAYGLHIRGLDTDKIEKKVTEMFKTLKMREEDMRKNPLTFSGGEIQRLALARAVIVEPTLLLLDEPTANLDEESAKEFEELLKKLNKSKNMTILFSTHDKKQAQRLTKKIYHIKQGKLVKV